jgi:drug/metabolite transporter (DMT)-like permease
MSADMNGRGVWFPGVPLALGAAVLFGASTPLSKLLLGVVNPWLLAGILYLGAGVGLSLFLLVRHAAVEDEAESPLRLKDLPWLAAVVAAGGIAGPVLLMFGLSTTDASSASLLLNLEGVFTMAIAWLVFRENVDRRLMLGAAAILAGATLISWNGEGFAVSWGSLLIAGACLAWGIDNNLTRKLSASDPVQIAAIKGVTAGAVNTTLAFYLGAPTVSLTMVVYGVVVGFFGIGVSLVFFMLGLRHLGTARTGAYFSLAPFIGALLSILILGDAFTLELIIAGVLMAIGLWLHLSERHEHEHSHEEIEHEHRHVHDAHHQHEHDGAVTEPHSHTHRHKPLRHKHPHYPDLHHRHGHGQG